MSVTRRALRFPGAGLTRLETTGFKLASVESGEESLVITDSAVKRRREISGEGEAWLRDNVMTSMLIVSESSQVG